MCNGMSAKSDLLIVFRESIMALSAVGGVWNVLVT